MRYRNHPTRTYRAHPVPGEVVKVVELLVVLLVGAERCLLNSLCATPFLIWWQQLSARRAAEISKRWYHYLLGLLTLVSFGVEVARKTSWVTQNHVNRKRISHGKSSRSMVFTGDLTWSAVLKGLFRLYERPFQTKIRSLSSVVQSPEYVSRGNGDLDGRDYK